MGLQSGEIPFGRGNASLLWCHNMGEDKCTLYKNPAFLLGKHHFLVYKREVELQVNIRKMDQSCVSLLSGRVGGISLKAGHRTHSGHTVPLAPTAFPKKANREEFVFHSTGEALQKQAKNFLKTGSHRSASDLKKKNMEYRKGSKPGNSQAWSLTVIGKNPSLLFCRFRFANSYHAMDAWRPSTKALTQSPRHNASLDVQRLSRLRRQPRKQTAIMACSVPQGKSYGSNQPIGRTASFRAYGVS